MRRISMVGCSRCGLVRTATAAIWPLIVDGLLTLATVELWRGQRGSGRWLAWAAFLFGISLSLCANIGAAPSLSVFGVTVAACPPLALLLAAELLNRALRRHRPGKADFSSHNVEAVDLAAEVTVAKQETAESLPAAPEPENELNAEQRMWLHYQQETAMGRRPSGAELDRVAGTHNYGRRVLRRWRTAGRLGEVAQEPTMADAFDVRNWPARETHGADPVIGQTETGQITHTH